MTYETTALILGRLANNKQVHLEGLSYKWDISGDIYPDKGNEKYALRVSNGFQGRIREFSEPKKIIETLNMQEKRHSYGVEEWICTDKGVD